jgi:hypothetical protein
MDDGLVQVAGPVINDGVHQPQPPAGEVDAGEPAIGGVIGTAPGRGWAGVRPTGPTR